MKHSRLFKTTGMAAALVLSAFQAQASSVDAYTTSNVNLRAGPSTSYPSITVVPAGATLSNYGCLADYSWCDVSYSSNRGWVSANSIEIVYQDQRQTMSPGVAFAAGITITAFSEAYWNNHYRSYPWYPNWNRYALPPRPRPYLPPPGWRAPRGWGGPPPGWRAPPGYHPAWHDAEPAARPVERPPVARDAPAVRREEPVRRAAPVRPEAPVRREVPRAPERHIERR
nr:SH3 domain-containing protein [Marinicella sp. W31]MDC2876625.1 SH3 domain-containing protein [Marinicella sp. W31]